jgi:hypothetical protein
MTNELPLFEKGALRLYLGCCCTRNKIDFKLNLDKVAEYYEDNLKSLEVDTAFISGLVLGPRSVVETFTGPSLDGVRTLIMNSSYSIDKLHNVSCPSSGNEKQTKTNANIRSFRLWNYEFYDKTTNVKYCTNNNECGMNEYCLCPDGQMQPEWCVKEKKRCLPTSQYLQSNMPTISNSDLLNKQCIADQIAKLPSGSVNINDITNFASRCAYGPNYIEGFNYNNPMNYTNMLIIFIIFIVLIILFFIIKHI